MTTEALPKPLNRERLKNAVIALSEQDSDFAMIYAAHGLPPLLDRPQSFETLVRIILEQQVSLVSADAMYQRLKTQLKTLSVSSVLKAEAPFLRSVGVTTQKSRYIVNVAEAIDSGELCLHQLAFLDDELAIKKLVDIKGVGPWTAQIYLLNALLRPNVWPAGDIALATAIKRLKKLEQRPKPDEMKAFADIWSPYRATAARLLWHYYLSDKKGVSTA